MKVISEVVSVILILIISLGLISTILMYGYPLIMKAQDKIALERVISLFHPDLPGSIVKKMEDISKAGGSVTINLEVDGVWKVISFSENSELNNSLSFTFFSRVTNIKSDQYISLSSGETCPPKQGILGVSSPFVVCIMGSSTHMGFTITYTLFARNLTSENQVYSVRLTSNLGGRGESTSRTIRVRRVDSEMKIIQEGEKKIIIVPLEISL